MDDLVWIATGTDGAGIEHRKESADAYEVQQYHLELLKQARAVDNTDHRWQVWPEMTARAALGMPAKRETTERKPLPKQKQRRMPYDD